MPDEFLTIRNDGPVIVETNYWNTRPALDAKILVSLNAGTVRVLLPRSYGTEVMLASLGAIGAALTRGEWVDVPGRPTAYELLLDDGSADPYAIFVLPAAFVSGQLAESDFGRRVPLVFYVHSEKPPGFVAWEPRPCTLRKAATLPHLAPWDQV